jgi:hypothetical protein
MLINLFDSHTDDPDDFVAFIVFEPASLRIPDTDVLLISTPVVELFSKAQNSTFLTDSLQDQSLINRLTRIGMMIDLLKSDSGLILTKFLSPIWRRYSFFSNLGELFLSKRDLNRLVPDAQFQNPIFLDRFMDSDDSDGDDK